MSKHCNAQTSFHEKKRFKQLRKGKPFHQKQKKATPLMPRLDQQCVPYVEAVGIDICWSTVECD